MLYWRLSLPLCFAIWTNKIKKLRIPWDGTGEKKKKLGQSADTNLTFSEYLLGVSL